jgi:hypothetical protein
MSTHGITEGDTYHHKKYASPQHMLRIKEIIQISDF